jgi:hypothetical protein
MNQYVSVIKERDASLRPWSFVDENTHKAHEYVVTHREGELTQVSPLSLTPFSISSVTVPSRRTPDAGHRPFSISPALPSPSPPQPCASPDGRLRCNPSASATSPQPRSPAAGHPDILTVRITSAAAPLPNHSPTHLQSSQVVAGRPVVEDAAGRQATRARAELLPLVFRVPVLASPLRPPVRAPFTAGSSRVWSRPAASDHRSCCWLYESCVPQPIPYPPILFCPF